MIIVGINGGHDASISVIRDNVILGTYEKERFTRIKHDGGDISSILPIILKMHDISPNEVNLIATTEPVHKNKDAGYKILYGIKYKRPDEYSHYLIELNNYIYPAVSVAHHLCHASYSVYTSNFEDCTTITWDGGGDFYTEDAYASTTISYWKNKKFSFLERIDNCDFGSLWYTYANGIFGNGDHAGKLMGLSAYGTDRLVNQFYERFTAQTQGHFAGARIIKNCWPDYYNVPFYKKGDTWEARNTKDIAYAIQQLTTSCGLELCRIAKQKTASNNLTLSGGVALNGYLNTAIKESSVFENVFIPPAVHDGGLSLGAALFVSHNILDEPVTSIPHKDLAFLGSSYSLFPTDVEGYAGISVAKKNAMEAAELAAKMMSEGRVIGWYEGRSEHGPRALGHRSMLASPVIKGIKDHINKEIKKREHFRPLAPIVLESECEKYFAYNGKGAYFMMDIVKAKPQTEALAPEIVHVDKTARLQTAHSGSSMGQLLNHLKRYTGVPIAINTSLNISEPIIETPTEAMNVLMKTGLHAIFINDTWIVKK